MKKIIWCVSLLFLLAIRMQECSAQSQTNAAPLALANIQKVLIMGNSLTRHGPSTEKLGWSHSFGMAATKEENDYVHQLYARICAVQQPVGRLPQLKVMSMLAANIHTPEEAVDYAADYIVLQMGDNLAPEKASVDTLTKPYIKLVEDLKQAQPHAVIFVTSLWGDAGADDPRSSLIQQVCEATGATFVDLRLIAANPQNRAASEGVYQNRGVAWHPGDRGMKAIADAIWQKTEQVYTGEAHGNVEETKSNVQPWVGEIAYQNSFENREQVKSLPGYNAKKMSVENGYQSSSSLRVECLPEQGTDDANSAEINISLPIEKMRGAMVDFSAMVKAEKVAQPAHSWNGVKVMFRVKRPNRTDYPQQSDVYGSFDWKKIDCRTVIPQDALSADLVLGLENVTGVAWFDNANVTVLALSRQRPVNPATGSVYKGHPSIPRLRGAMIPSSLTEDSARVLGKKWNANLVRYQLFWPDYPRNEGDLEEGAYDKWLNEILGRLDKFLLEAKKDGLMVVIDLHTPPGGNTPDRSNRIFNEKKYQDQFVQVWDKISRRYRGNEIVWGYDLVNEPMEGIVPAGVLSWHDLALKTAKLVRHNDPDHTIIVEASFGGAPLGFDFMEPLQVPGVVYSVHMYIPWAYTGQGVGNIPIGQAYPGKIEGIEGDGKEWNKAQLRKMLRPVIEFQHDYNVQIYVGEAGVVRWAPGAAQWLSDVIDIFEENDWDWSYHAFREWQGWNVELGTDQKDVTISPTETDREKVIRSWFSKNTKPAWYRPY